MMNGNPAGVEGKQLKHPHILCNNYSSTIKLTSMEQRIGTGGKRFDRGPIL